MKRTLFSLTLVLAIATTFIIISCSKENEQVIDYKNEFEKASLLHNNAMDYVLSKLDKKQLSDKKQILETVKLSVNEYVDNNMHFFQDVKESKKILNGEANRLVAFYNESKNSKLGATFNESDFLLNTIESLSGNLSSAQRELLLEINNAFENYNSPTEIISSLNNIKDVKSQQLPAEERYVIYAATTTGIQSVEYWSQNLDKWISTITNNKKLSKENLASKGWFNWGSVGKNDVAGAVGGAIGGAVVGAAAGGVGAGPGAAIGFVGGGIGTSATDATLQVLNHYF